MSELLHDLEARLANLRSAKQTIKDEIDEIEVKISRAFVGPIPKATSLAPELWAAEFNKLFLESLDTAMVRRARPNSGE